MCALLELLLYINSELECIRYLSLDAFLSHRDSFVSVIAENIKFNLFKKPLFILIYLLFVLRELIYCQPCKCFNQTITSN